MKKFFLFLILFLIIAVAAYVGGSMYEKSEGVRTGSLNKFSKKGIVFKTYEGTVNQEVLNTNEKGFSGNTWYFSVDKEKQALVDSLLRHDGGTYRFFYKENLNALPWLGDSEYFVYKIESIQNRDRGMRNF